MFKILKRSVKRWKPYQYYSWMGFTEALIFILYEKLGYEKYRNVNIANQKIIIRTQTSDLQVVVDSLVYKEYENIKCNSPSVIIDAGANIGSSTIFFAKKYPMSRIFAIEPEQENYQILKKNISQFENVIPINAALANKKGKLEILDPHTGAWGYTVTDIKRDTHKKGQTVDSISIPALMDRYSIDIIDILKLDIEGGEKEVFETSTEWIDRVNIVTVELHDRLKMGCSRSFYLATRNFEEFEKNGEKITAYRN